MVASSRHRRTRACFIGRRYGHKMQVQHKKCTIVGGFGLTRSADFNTEGNPKQERVTGYNIQPSLSKKKTAADSQASHSFF